MQKRFFRLLAVSAAAVLMLCVSAGTVWAQGANASIGGTVLDASGSAVPDAEVTVENSALGLERKLSTTGAGVFSAPSLPPASGYTLTVTKTGFSKYTVAPFDLAVGQQLGLSVVLTVAGTGTAVEVTSDAPVVETTKTDVSGVVDSNQIMNLPINGRRVDSFVLLQPGVTNDATFGLLSFRGQAGGNTFLTDGIDTTNTFYNENAGRTRTYNISQDAVQEFQVVTSNFLPEYGRASGGIVNTVTRSGNNELHGTAYWFFRNRTLNATDPTSGGLNPPNTRHQAGASIGGPIKKNKLFYFFNGELQRIENPIVSSNITSTLYNANGVPTGAVDPVTGCGGSSYAIRASGAQCTALLGYLQGRVAPQVVPRKVDVNLMFAKLDYQINDRNRFNAELNYLDFRSPNGIQTQGALTNGNAVGNNADTNVFDRTVKSGLTTVLGANSVNEVRFGLFKDRQYDPASPSLLPSVGPIGLSITSGSLSNIGYATAYPRLHPSELRYQLSDTYSLTVNRHTLKFGVDYAHTEDYDLQRANQFGTYTYANINALALDYSGAANGKNWTTYTQTFGNPVWDGVMQDVALFAQDEIHINKFTISPGIRYEHTNLPQPTAPQPLGALNIPGDWPQTATLNYKANNVAPRIGIAYALDSKTVIRVGYGLFYNRYVSQIVDGLAKGNGSYQPSYTFQASTPAQFAAGPIFPNFLPTPPNTAANAPTIQFDTKDFRNTYSEQGQLSIQREVARNTSVTASYIWSRGLHIATAYNANLSAPTLSYTYPVYSDTAGTNLIGSYTAPLYTRAQLINPNYNGVYAMSSNANSYYNGLTVGVNRRYSGWFEVSGGYTWSHTIDYNIGGAAGATGSSGVLFAQTAPTSFNNNDFRFEKGNAATDQRQKVFATAILNPKFTRGNSFVEKYFINGWQLSVLTQAASSFHIDSTIGGVSASTLPALPAGQSYFATSTINGLGGFNATRVPFQPVGNLLVPPTYRTDARISKIFSVTERIKVQLGFEAQNVFNHLIVAGASPLNQQEYSLISSGGISKLVPFPLYKQITATQALLGESTARRAQASIRITF